jgi:cytidylate kinase
MIDTTQMNIEDVVNVIVEWIEAERKRNSLLSPETQWWK